MAIINEAPYKLRRSYVILLALWFANKKPPREAFLKDVILELKRLETDGFVVQGKRYKLRVVVITTDTVARPLIWNKTQFNGLHGCDFCLMPGKRVPKGGGSVRVYPEPAVGEPPYPRRTFAQHMKDLEEIRKTGKTVNGIFGPTPFQELDNFDFILACVPEYLHSCCQGVMKQLITLWFSSDRNNKKKPWYIGNKIHIINARLAQIKPPYEITRSTGAIDDIPNWKASMFKTFGLYFFQVLEGILPNEYFEHFTMFSYGLFCLLQAEISVEDVRKIDVLFKRFVVELERLYGAEHVSINMHLLTHLAQSVLDWGCLWSTSTFIPEWFNGHLLTLCNGSQYVADQMAKNYLLKIAVRNETVALLKSDAVVPDSVSQLLIDMLHLPVDLCAEEEKDFVLVNDSTVKLLGVPDDSRRMNSAEREAMRKLFLNSSFNSSALLTNGIFDRCKFYSRFELQNSSSIFTTVGYNRSPKRINYCALMNDGSFFFIESIVFLDVPPIGRCFIIGKPLGVISKRTYLPKPINETVFSIFPGQTMKCEGLGSTLLAYDPKTIVSKCVVAMKNSLTETFVVTALANSFETD